MKPRSRRNTLRLVGYGFTGWSVGCLTPKIVSSGDESPQTTLPSTAAAESSALTTPLSPPTKDEGPVDTQRFEFTGCTATVHLSCSEFWILVQPSAIEYFLVMLYRSQTTNKLYRFVAGPLSGCVTDSFGDYGFQLLGATIQVPNEHPINVPLPNRCFDAENPRNRLSVGPSEA
ncbi:hypothetical protein [Haloferax sp. DFSO52]|uniref:hypothetical protein n=1 Tax=Haloferax sp. DFSO52 TaxID=3388505 RepID=UPI003A83E7B8